jgi:mannitol 2-dehydrogenase
MLSTTDAGGPVELGQATLDQLPADLPRPTYDRSALRIGIVHIGVGGFHRAHQAMYVDRLLEAGLAQDWAICGVGILPGDAAMAEVLAAQDGLYTLVQKHNDGHLEARVIGSIVRYLHAPADPEAVLEQLAAPGTRIVSLTVTEGGYAVDAVTGHFDPADPAVAADLARSGPPGSTFGLVTEALRRRRDRGLPAFTVVSCDNIEGNGHVAQRAFTAFARHGDPELADWIEASVRFPSSMVDRITPRTTPEDVELVRTRIGVADRWPVVCEPFTQWVLEDSFGDGRPPLEEAGVQVVDDVRPYELMKLRMLNAGHQALGYFAYLAGHRLVHEAAQDPLIARFVLDYMALEGAPTLSPVPGIDLPRYQRELVERFSNAGVRDTVARLCAESSDRIPKWVLPVIREQLAAGGSIERATAVVASWARYAEGTDEDGQPIDVVDRFAQALTELARAGGAAFIENRALFGDLADDVRFRESYLRTLRRLHEVGARRTLGELVSPGGG